MSVKHLYPIKLDTPLKRGIVILKMFHVFTNGQFSYFFTGYPAGQHLFFSKKDVFSNRLWERLDQPRVAFGLMRFERRYIKTNRNRKHG